MLVNEIIKHTILQYRRKDTNFPPQPSFKIVLIPIKTVQFNIHSVTIFPQMDACLAPLSYFSSEEERCILEKCREYERAQAGVRVPNRSTGVYKMGGLGDYFES
jgi:hypothetical protein